MIQLKMEFTGKHIHMAFHNLNLRLRLLNLSSFCSTFSNGFKEIICNNSIVLIRLNAQSSHSSTVWPKYLFMCKHRHVFLYSSWLRVERMLDNSLLSFHCNYGKIGSHTLFSIECSLQTIFCMLFHFFLFSFFHILWIFSCFFFHICFRFLFTLKFIRIEYNSLFHHSIYH